MSDEAAAPPPSKRPIRARMALPEPIAAVALVVLGCTCAGLLLALPRPIAPVELPNLTLPEAETLRVIEDDARAARTAPQTPHAQALEALLLAHGRAEAQGMEDSATYQERRTTLAERYAELSAELGEPKALALRSKAVVQLQRALELELPKAEATALLGAFPNLLARENVTVDGLIVAPVLVVRTLFKARWNILCGLKPTHALQPVEQRAYFGWQALHAGRVALPHRIEALETYARLGGDDADEALGVLMLRAGNGPDAARAFEAAYRKTGTLRLRNAILAARIVPKPSN